MQTNRFFVVANALVCAYLVLSLVLSILHVIKSTVVFTRIILVVFDTVITFAIHQLGKIAREMIV